MTTMLPASVQQAGAAVGRGRIGDRQLVCVQTFDIARLTSAPVPIVAGHFIAVTGRGPKGDSNESGKTSFLSCVSLLLGDPEWRMSGTAGSAASALLFERETAGAAAVRSATHGYVIGVFADERDEQTEPITVIVRINSTAPYIQVRTAPGVALVAGPDDRARHERVDAAWSEIGGSRQLGARTYVEDLYGDTPRCLAYLTTRGKQRSDRSLLQLDGGHFRPEEIGETLVKLTGKADTFERDLEYRLAVDASAQELSVQQLEDEARRRDEDEHLSAIEARDSARGHLANARELWRLRFARGLIDAVEQRGLLEGLLDEARERLRTAERSVQKATERLEALQNDHEAPARAAEEAGRALASADAAWDACKAAEATARSALDGAHARRDELRPSAVDAPDSDLDSATAATSRARERLTAADQDVGAARADLDQAAAHLEAMEAGGAAGVAEAARAALREAGIRAAVLLDELVIADNARSEWEARLSPWSDALTVESAQLDAALEAMGPFAGVALVHGSGDEAEAGPLPGGVTHAPAAARPFLRALADAWTGRDGTPDVVEQSNIVLVGGFEHPVAGRSARVESAQARLSAAAEAFTRADTFRTQQQLALTVAEDDLARVRAREALHEIEAGLPQLEADLRDAQADSQAAAATRSDAMQASIDAGSTLKGHGVEIDNAVHQLESARRAAQIEHEAITDHEAAIERLRIDSFWRKGWGKDDDLARAAVERDTRSEKRLRNVANLCLGDALSVLGVLNDGSGAPDDQIRSAVTRRGSASSDDEGGELTTAFAALVNAVAEHLDDRAEHDHDARERIERDRTAREAALGSVAERLEADRAGLLELQDGIEASLTRSLEAISAELDRLDRDAGGYGAELEISCLRPAGPDDVWRWPVVPRWRRSPGGNMLRYDSQTNSAQEKLFTVHLVLAALLASHAPRGRVLVLDELGDSLGEVHRRDVLRAIAATAEAKQITVLGTCQDSMISEATEVCRQILYFEYPSKSVPLNRPTRVWAFDDQRSRVELTAEALQIGRPLA